MCYLNPFGWWMSWQANVANIWTYLLPLCYYCLYCYYFVYSWRAWYSMATKINWKLVHRIAIQSQTYLLFFCKYTEMYYTIHIIRNMKQWNNNVGVKMCFWCYLCLLVCSVVELCGGYETWSRMLCNGILILCYWKYRRNWETSPFPIQFDRFTCHFGFWLK